MDDFRQDVMFCLGRVYNITQYLEYHPGGIPELMRGAGSDATHLFNEVGSDRSAQVGARSTGGRSD